MRLPRRPSVLVGTALAAGLVLAAAAPALAAPPPVTGPGAGLAQHALRSGVTDEDFYFLMADRFANGSTANDTGGLTGDRETTGFDPTSKGYYNGGDLKGLRNRLDYIQGLGTDSIWLTPSFKNKAVQPEDSSAGYHGYWITDFTQIDPHLGTNADLAALVKAAHARGMKVYFDIITNHTADVIGYQEGARTAYVPKDVTPYKDASGTAFDDRAYAGTSAFPALDAATSFPYHPVLAPGEEHVKVPDWLNDVTLYHNRGNTTFTGEDSQYGDFFGLDDLMTENPEVVKGMTDIYSTWIGDFGIDGYRIDTMKHVNDEFWQSFSPGILQYAKEHGKPDFFMFGEVALDGTDDAARALSSHYTTHDGVQSVLDFPFKDAARNFASKGQPASQLADFFAADDWYTDADSNVYELPTFLGNHDIGRIGYFLKTDNPAASEDELIARDELAHELMYFSRGNPVIYYGDEQGFTGTGGDQLARQTMFASQVPEYLDDDLLGTTRTHAQNNFTTDHPLYQAVSQLAQLTKANPALRNGAEQVRYASDGAGIYAFSRVDRADQREYVVALNNSTAASTATVPTFGSRNFTVLYGQGTGSTVKTTDGQLQVSVPPLSAVVLKANGRMPKSAAAPAVTVAAPAAAAADNGRMHVTAQVAGGSFYEVTFQAKVGAGAWTSISTDDSAPYQVFHDTSGLATGTPVQYRAVVLDNARHTSVSAATATAVPAPTVALSSPTGDTVASIYPVTVSATVTPERSSQAVRFQRSVGGGAWQDLGTDTSSPAYQVTDTVSDLALGTTVAYRAQLFEPEDATAPVVTSATRTVTVSAPQPARTSVTLAGSLQSEIGCPGDWQPDCATSHLAFDATDGQWHGTFALPEGHYEWKIAINDAWTESWGAGGGGDNIVLDVPAGGGSYRFTWDQVTHVPSVTTG